MKEQTVGGWVDRFLERYDIADQTLVAAGFPETSPWWRAQLERFLRSGRRSFVLRVGRRGGKSSTLCRFAVCWALWGPWTIPPGDTGVIAFVSVSRDESSQRLRTIEAILRALGVTATRSGDAIELAERDAIFKTFSATIGGVSGFTSVLFIGDEVAKWRDADSGANPATEVLASARPTLATVPNARMFLCSSPMGLLDAHAEAFEFGNTDAQIVAHAESWVSNPSITEADTRLLEPDPRRHAREFGAQPQAGTCATFDADAVMRCFEEFADPITEHPRVLILDPSSGRKDTFSWGICGWNEGEDGSYLEFDLVDGLGGSFWQQVSGDEIVAKLAALCREYGVHEVHADQRESLMMKSAFEKLGFRYVPHDWTASSKPLAVETVRRWLAEDALSLPVHDKLQRELLNFEERITPSGAFTFGARGSGHDDFVALILTAAMTEMNGELDGSPLLVPASGYQPQVWTVPGYDQAGIGFEDSYSCSIHAAPTPIIGGGRMGQIDNYFASRGMSRAA